MAIIDMKAQLMLVLKAQLMLFFIAWSVGAEHQPPWVAFALADQHHRCRLSVHSKVVAIPSDLQYATTAWNPVERSCMVCSEIKEKEETTI